MEHKAFTSSEKFCKFSESIPVPFEGLEYDWFTSDRTEKWPKNNDNRS